MKANKLTRRVRIKHQIRKKVQGTEQRPRFVVFRSNKNIYAQLIDDVNGKTIITVNPNSKEIKDKVTASGKVNASKEIGKQIGEKAIALNIKNVIFDRNGYLYHGRVKAVADGAREVGLNF